MKKALFTTLLMAVALMFTGCQNSAGSSDDEILKNTDVQNTTTSNPSENGTGTNTNPIDDLLSNIQINYEFKPAPQTPALPTGTGYNTDFPFELDTEYIKRDDKNLYKIIFRSNGTAEYSRYNESTLDADVIYKYTIDTENSCFYCKIDKVRMLSKNEYKNYDEIIYYLKTLYIDDIFKEYYIYGENFYMLTYNYEDRLEEKYGTTEGYDNFKTFREKNSAVDVFDFIYPDVNIAFMRDNKISSLAEHYEKMFSRFLKYNYTIIDGEIYVEYLSDEKKLQYPYIDYSYDDLMKFDYIGSLSTGGNRYTVEFKDEKFNNETQLLYEFRSITVDENTTLTKQILQDLYEYNYIFLGWYDGETLVKPYEYVVTKDVTLKAKWKPKAVYVVTYKSEYNGCVVEVDEYGDITGDESLDEGDYVYLPEITAEGYNFLGWYVGEDLIQTYEYVVNGDVTLVAKWEPIN